MPLQNINTFFPGKIAQSVCWMLVHSLWIGLALAVVTGIIILCTKRQTALLRYNLLSAALLLFTIGMIGVFLLQLSDTGSTINNEVAGSTAAAIIHTNHNIPAFTITTDTVGVTASINNFLNGQATTIALVWLFIIAFRAVRLIGGLHKIKQIKTTQLQPVGDYWNERLLEFASTLQIKTRVQFFQSGIAKIPMVVGHFKPVILFPVGLITALPVAEVEAVLLHELAHIKRKDYLVNMLQHFVEILFFFNPAILWVSALIKLERENCCDDIAIAQSSSKRNYINALVSFQEYHLNAPQYATALAHNKKHLLQRVKRMLYNNNKTLNAMEKTFLTVCFIVTILLTVFFTQAQNKSANATTTIATKDTPIAERHYNPANFEEGGNYSFSETTNGISHTLYIFKRKGILYEVFGDITSLKIDGKLIPQEQWGNYKTLISQLKKDYANGHIAETNATKEDSPENALLLAKLDAAQKQLTQNQEKLTTERKQIQSLESKEKLTAEMDALTATLDNAAAERDGLAGKLAQLKKEQQALKAQGKSDAKLNELTATITKLKAEQDIQATQQRKQEIEMQKTIQKKIMDEQQQILDAQKQKAAADLQKMKAEEKEKVQGMSSHKRVIERSSDESGKAIKSSLSYTEYGEPYNTAYNTYQPAKNSYKLTGIQSEASNNTKDVDIKLLTNNLIADLMAEKVITNVADLSYKVSNDVLIVNGKVQSEALHQKLKAKYIKSPDWKLLYNWSIN